MEESKMPEQRGGNRGTFPGGDRTPGSGKKGENMGGGSIKKDRPMETGRKPTQNPGRP
ncbi:hypothetical protein D9M68_697390 [compost metagenome]